MRRFLLSLVLALPAFAAYPNGYTYCKVITVKTYNGGSGGMVSGTSNLSNFPVTIAFTDSNFAVVGSGGKVQSSSGYDIVFDDSTSCSGAGTALAWENEVYTSATGQYLSFAKFATLHYAADDKISVYFGKAGVASFQGGASTAVWDTNYKMVSHFGGTISSALTDSTGNYSMTNVGGATSAAGFMGNAGSFNGASSIFNSTITAITFPFTLESWANPAAGGGVVAAISRPDGGYNGYYSSVDTSNASATSYANGDAGANSATEASAGGVWQHVVAVFNSASSRTVYVNGIAVSSSATNGTFVTQTLQIGAVWWNTGYISYFHGLIDEVRMSIVARSADWISTSYRNQSAPSTYIALGCTQTFGVGCVAGPIRHHVVGGE